MITHAHAPALDSALKNKLVDVARVRRELRLHRASTRRWLIVAAVGAGLLVWRAAAGAELPFSFPLLLAAMGTALVLGWRQSRRETLDLADAARAVEALFPELGVTLRTAWEQQPEGKEGLTFLQRRVVGDALAHEQRSLWETQVSRELAGKRAAHFGAMAAAFAVAVGLFLSVRRDAPAERAAAAAERSGATKIAVTPGNAEVERGTSVVIAARFEGGLPKGATLLWKTPVGVEQSVAMAQSLSDPVYAFTLPAAKEDVAYRIRYDGGVTEEFKLTVYDLPALVRADAALDYPEYTGLADRRIEDTRRVSAVEGTQLQYEFQVNKPLRKAALRAADGKEIALKALNPERTRFSTALRLEKTLRFSLRLEDDAGRANASPDDVRIEVVANRRPELKLISPNGDQRVSPIEEVRLQARARDDFGLIDYGVAFAIAQGEPDFRSLRGVETGGKPRVEATFEQLLALEERAVKTGELITWFVWADDFGPEGKQRRTNGDLFFAEVRPLDEIFREDTSGQSGNAGAGQNGGGQEREELLEMQRQISIAIWKVKQQDAKIPAFAEDVKTLVTSQERAQALLAGMAEELTEPAQRTAGEEAAKFMKQAKERLDAADTRRSADPLTAAWTGSQGAYQALMKLMPREYRVGQSRSQSGASGGQRGNQRQLNQLDFKQEQDRYETQSEAQAMESPEQRAQVQISAKLRELARRQQDVNQRLQELQTALAAAKDEAEREEIRRELKRLEEEQRRLLADTDEVRQKMDGMPAGERSRETREQLDRTREDMRRTSERLEEGEVSQALASGARARENLEDLRENFRNQTSSQFAEQLREVRKAARELAENQRQAGEALDQLDKGASRSLDDSERREGIARTLDGQKENLEKLRGDLKRIAEETEGGEPGLHRKVYDLVRQQEGGTAGEKLENSAELLRRGFVKQSQELQPEIAREIEQLRSGVERAAESVLGDETAELRYAQRELEELARQLRREQAEQERAAAAGEGGQGQRAAGTGAPGERESESSGAAAGREPGEGREGARAQAGAGADGERANRTGEGAGRGGSAQDAEREAERRRLAEGDGEPNRAGGAAGADAGATPGERADGRGEAERSGTAQAGGRRGGNQPGEGQGEAPGAGGQRGGAERSGAERGRGPGQGQTGAGGEPRGAETAERGAAQGQGQAQGGAQAGGQGQRPGQAGAGGGERGGQQARAGDGGARTGGAGGPDTGDGLRGGGGDGRDFAEALRGWSDASGGRMDGPLTGEGFNEWAERLRTVEELVQVPEVRQQLAAARERAEAMRREYKRHGAEPTRAQIEAGIASPMSQARVLLRQELARREQPDALQPVDRDPVPEKYAESVKEYYEALGR